MKAVLKNGMICPQEPLPNDWEDGTELRVEKTSNLTEKNADLDRWMAQVEESASDMDPEDEKILERSIREIRQQARDQARREAENP